MCDAVRGEKRGCGQTQGDAQLVVLPPLSACVYVGHGRPWPVRVGVRVAGPVRFPNGPKVYLCSRHDPAVS